MEAPARTASFQTVVKCTTCGRDIEMAAMAAHHCASVPAVQSFTPILPRTNSSSTLQSLRPPRPMLSKIDASGDFRPAMLKGELTPASSGHSSLASPVSAGSGPRSPFPMTRKASMPGPRRPPSPELTNLDCAFPPFPTAKSKEKDTRRRDRAGTQRSDSRPSRSREGSKSTRQAGRPAPLSRAGTFSSTSETSTRDGGSYPPALSTSRKDSSASIVLSQPSGVEALPHFATTLERAFTAPIEHTSPLKNSSTPPKSPTLPSDAQSFPKRDQSRVLEEAQPTVPSEDPSNYPSTPFPQPTLSSQPLTAEPEPLYKSKRPPPLSNLPDHQEFEPELLMKSPTAPSPHSAGILSKGLNRLFGRRPSASTAQRRDIARQALSDEPDAYPAELSPKTPSVASPTATETPPASQSPVAPSSALSGREESLKALEGWPLAAADPPIVVVEPSEDIESRKTPSVTATTETASSASATASRSATLESESSQELNRVSVDSASSYGSDEAFSERTASSRSSSPQTEGTMLLALESTYKNLLKPSNVDTPAPLHPRLPDDFLELPTDPAFQPGLLSPAADASLDSESIVSPRLSVLVEEPMDDLSAFPTVPGQSAAQGDETAFSSEEPSEQLQQSPSSAATVPRPSLEGKPEGISKRTLPNKGICRGCSQLILAAQRSVTSADGQLTGRYHKECFVCHTCKESFPTAEFYVHDDHPYCAHHYHELADSLCATCGKGIEGLYMETANVAGRGKEKHHPECLKCATCRVRLDHDYFELSGKVYCERDAFRLATLPKQHDNAPSRPSPLIREYISSGDPGLVKGRNFPERRITKLMNII